MSTHGFARPFRIALLNCRQNALVMELAPLGTSINLENAAALLAQKAHNRIQKRKNERVTDCLGHRQVEVEVGLDIGIRVVQVAQTKRSPSRQGQPGRASDPAQQMADARLEPERQWPVPFVVLAEELGDPANEAALTLALEAGVMGGYPAPGGRR